MTDTERGIELNSYIIRGGNRLSGEVVISGSKNASLGILSAAMLLDGPCKIENIPDIADLNVMIEICKGLGAQVKRETDGSLTIDPRSITSWEATQDKVRHISRFVLSAWRFAGPVPQGCHVHAGRLQFRDPAYRPAYERL